MRLSGSCGAHRGRPSYCSKANIPLDTDQLEAHYLAEGNVVQTVQALIAASKANIELSWNRACAIDLATRGTSKSVLEAVRTSINPKVIDCKIEGWDTIDGVAKDGIQVKVRARVTVRATWIVMSAVPKKKQLLPGLVKVLSPPLAHQKITRLFWKIPIKLPSKFSIVD